MTEHLKIWERFADIDPKFTKAITGKDYKGTSPNPHYVIKCLTELFGPVGIGFGWRVLAEDFTTIGQETLHWCRIEFWHTDRKNTYEAYGQTKAAYVTSGGKARFDEDAPKKSLTDAITKAASQIGIAANIFLGRWDDSKYVAAVDGEYRAAEKAAPDAANVDAAVAAITACTTGKALLAAIPGPLADLPQVRAAIIETLRIIVKGAQSTKALEIMADHFRPVWAEVEADATARANELRGEAPF